MLGSPAAGPGAGGAPHRSLWPHHHSPTVGPLAASIAPSSTAEAFSRYGLYGLFPPVSAAATASAFYSHGATTLGRYHAQQHKLSESYFSTPGGYTFGAPTPPPGSPYSPVPVAQLELLAKSFNTNSIVIQQQQQQSEYQQTININNSQIKTQEYPKRPIAEDQKRWSLVEDSRSNPMIPLTIKTESLTPNSLKSTCGCRNNSPAKSCKYISEGNGCSRTNPLCWTQSQSGGIQVKREPPLTPACQVAEITTSNNTAIKVEAASPNKIDVPVTSTSTSNSASIMHQTSAMSSISTCTNSAGNGTIPVGIAVARQRLQHDMQPNLQPQQPGGLLTTIGPSAGQMKEINSASVATAAMTVGVTNTGGTLLHCGDERTNNMASWPLPPTHGSTLTAPTLWQYPAPMPMESMLPLPLPMPPVGFQLVRDPTTGHFLLIPTASLEQLQQAVVWPSYPQTSSHVLLPPVPPPPLAPLQLLGSATSDYLTTASTTLHQHTQTHSTRLVAVTTDSKRKLPLPAHTLIKIESDCTNTPPLNILDQGSKTLQTVSTVASNTGTMFSDQNITPLVTTHVFYQHPTNLIQISQPSQPPETACRSQATSPVTCLTPPPETNASQSETEDTIPGVQDASNQTDTPICSEDDNTTHNIPEISNEAITEEDSVGCDEQQEVVSSCNSPRATTPVDFSVAEDNVVSTTESCFLKSKIALPPVQVPEVSDKNDAATEMKTVELQSMIKSDVVPVQPVQPLQQETVLEQTKKIVEEISDVTSSSSAVTKPAQNVDLSGLELLSNSIVEFEICRKTIEPVSVKIEKDDEKILGDKFVYSENEKDEVLKGIADMSLKDNETLAKESSEMTCQQNDTLDGLGLLCALAEQRILEEVKAENPDKKTEIFTAMKRERKCDSSEERRRIEKKLMRRSLDDHYEMRHKKFRVGEFEIERKRLLSESSEMEERKKDNETLDKTEWCEKDDTDKHSDKCDKLKIDEINCLCKSEHSKDCSGKNSMSCCENSAGWSKMNAMEFDMRMRLADLQKKYKEQQLKLSKLTPRKECGEHCLKKIFGKSKRKSISSERKSLSPPRLEKVDASPIRTKSYAIDILKPPTLNAHFDANNFKKFKIKTPDEIKIERDESKKDNYSMKRKLSPDPEVLSDSTPGRSSSKKRKVGRPKKISTPDLHEATEMIVAKKPKSLVGYLLAAKSRLHAQNKNFSNSSPPRYHIEDSPSPKPVIKSSSSLKTSSHKSRSKSVSKSSKKRSKTSSGSGSRKHSKMSKASSKIRPKLKAEPKMKTYSEEEETSSTDWSQEDSSNVEGHDEDDEHAEEEEVVADDVQEQTDSDEIKDKMEVDNVESNENEIEKDIRCILTADHLEVDKLRVLTSMGGLFYAGKLSAIRAPDVYAITLDGERGNRPHIMSREEILRDAIVEVSPATTGELLPGTRLCAYWSQQYRCLYPGTVAEPGTPDPSLDHRFVSVEFDDGDSGRIALEDIRLLPPDYPIVEYDPNPLLSLSKRKRRTSVVSVSEDRRSVANNMCNQPTTSSETKQKQDKEELTTKLVSTSNNKSISEEQIRRAHKKLKKHRKDKVKRLADKSDEKKRKHKHKNCDDNCRHSKKHHKKHKKHKKHHHSDKEEVNEMKPDEEPETLVASEMTEIVENVEEDSYETIEQEQENAQIEEVEEQEEDEDDDDEEEEQEEERDNNADNKNSEKSKSQQRRDSVESHSKIAPFLSSLWEWSGKGYKRAGGKGRAKKEFFKTIQRDEKETITVGDCAVFISTGRPDRPYIGKIDSMWETRGSSMSVRVKWFYHPEETDGGPENLKFNGALFESSHYDVNDVQTISHKCEVLSFDNFKSKLGLEPKNYAAVYDNNDTYYHAGYYDPTNKKISIYANIEFNYAEET